MPMIKHNIYDKMEFVEQFKKRRLSDVYFQ
jgi:hypothetical protein